MTKEDKILLAKDIFSRALCGLKVNYHDEVYTLGYNLYLNEGSTAFESYPIKFYLDKIDEIKPYLRSMSTMTNKEIKEFSKLFDKWNDDELFDFVEEGIEFSVWKHHGISPMIFDWLNKHHFDYRGLIIKGFALEAPKGMYNINK